MPLLSDSVARKFTDSVEVSEWEIDTDTGWQDIHTVSLTVPYRVWQLTLVDGSSLDAADTHIVFDDQLQEVFVRDLRPGDKVMTRSGPVAVASVEQTEAVEPMYDLDVNSADHRFYSGNILSHNSVTVVSYFLWMILFHDQQNIAILANKGSLARELLAKIKLAYEYLPTWLQQGITTWNKGNIELENGSKVLAASTTSSAVRGGSFNCVSGESRIDIKIDDHTYSLSIQQLHHITANSSRRCINTTDVFLDELENIDVFREQIHKMVLVDHQKSTDDSCNIEHKIYDQSTSYYSEMHGRTEHNRQSCDIDHSRASSSASIADPYGRIISSSPQTTICVLENVDGSTRIDDEFETPSVDSIYTETQRFAENISIGKDSFDRDEIKNETQFSRSQTHRGIEREKSNITFGGIQRNQKTRGIWEEAIIGIDWEKEDSRTYGKDQSQSNQDRKDGSNSSGYEAKRRIKASNVGSSQRAHSMEQRIQIRTASGWKAFTGIRATPQQSTITVELSSGQSIRCTPDHLLKTDLSWIPAKSVSYRQIQTIDGWHSVDAIREHHEPESVYDILGVEDVHSFFANDISVHNCVFLDEFAFVQPNMATEFFASVYPVISSGKSTKLFIVSTPNGLNHYYKMWMDAVNKKSLYHPVEVNWDAMPGRDEKWKAETIRNTSQEQWDQEYGCSFLGSSATLISAQKLRTLVFTDPIIKTAMGVEVFEKPVGPKLTADEKGKTLTVPAHLYALVADVSHGVGMDNSAFSVIDITEAPFRQVAKYMNNEIAPSAYPDVIATTAKYYNNAYVLCESNDIGMQILNDLQIELEVENILGTALTKRGQRLSAGTTTKHRLGVKTTTAVKRIGCAALKDLIEHDQLIVNDYTTINELSTFVRRLKSFEAEEGCHDDMVMGLVLFGWLSAQTVFKELTNTNIRARMAQSRLSQLEDDMRPDPILVMDGQSGLIDPMDLELGYNDYRVSTVW